MSAKFQSHRDATLGADDGSHLIREQRSDLSVTGHSGPLRDMSKDISHTDLLSTRYQIQTAWPDRSQLGIVWVFLFCGFVENARFGSFAAEPFSPSASLCPLLVQ